MHYKGESVYTIEHHGVKGMHWYVRRYQKYNKGDRAAIKGTFIGKAGTHEQETKKLLDTRAIRFKEKNTNEVKYEQKVDSLIDKAGKDIIKGKTKDVDTVSLVKEMFNGTEDPGRRVYLMSKSPKAFSAQEIRNTIDEYMNDSIGRKNISERIQKQYQKLHKNVKSGKVNSSSERLAKKFNKAIDRYNVTPEGTYRPLNRIDVERLKKKRS